jgi:hypothetical protein
MHVPLVVVGAGPGPVGAQRLSCQTSVPTGLVVMVLQGAGVCQLLERALAAIALS